MAHILVIASYPESPVLFRGELLRILVARGHRDSPGVLLLLEPGRQAAQAGGCPCGATPGGDLSPENVALKASGFDCFRWPRATDRLHG